MENRCSIYLCLSCLEMGNLKQEALGACFSAYVVGFCGLLSSLREEVGGHHDREWEIWITEWRGNRHATAGLVSWEVWTWWHLASLIRKQKLSLPNVFKCGPTATLFPAAWETKVEFCMTKVCRMEGMFHLRLFKFWNYCFKFLWTVGSTSLWMTWFKWVVFQWVQWSQQSRNPAYNLFFLASLLLCDRHF